MAKVNPDLVFCAELRRISEGINKTTVEHGFWEGHNDCDGTKIALIHSEASELLEAVRTGNLQSDHIPAFSLAEEECADIIIRVLDLAWRRNWNVAEAILAKTLYNKFRPPMHGGKAF